MQISKLSAGNWRKYFTVVAAKPLLIKTLPHFQMWTENPRVGGSIPPLATTSYMLVTFILLYSPANSRLDSEVISVVTARGNDSSADRKMHGFER